MQHRHVEPLADILLDLTLKAVDHGVAEGTWREHGLRAVRLGGLDVRPGQLDGDALVGGGGVESAALGAAAVIDRAAAEELGEPLEGNVVAGIDEAIALRRAGDVATVEGGDGEPGKRPHHELAQALKADVL